MQGVYACKCLLRLNFGNALIFLWYQTLLTEFADIVKNGKIDMAVNVWHYSKIVTFLVQLSKW